MASGAGGKDTKEYPTAEALFKDLERLGVRTEVITKTMRALEDPTGDGSDRLWAGELMKPKAKVANSFDSFERPKIHTVNLRVTDSEGIDYDVYGGDPSGCPPVPRVGESVRYYLGRGEVASVEHSFRRVQQ